MKMLVDLFPVILFFVAYKFFGIYVATQVAIAAAVLQVAYLKLRRKRIENTHWITLILLIVFGGLTLFLHDPTFIKWKPTIVNWLLGAGFLLSAIFMERSFLRRMMDSSLTLPDAVWRKLNIAWIVFFFASGAINLIVAYNFSEDTWVNFKLFGLLGLTLLFVVAQGFYLAKYLQTDSDSPQTQED